MDEGKELKRRGSLVLIFISFMNRRSALCSGKQLGHPVYEMPSRHLDGSAGSTGAEDLQGLDYGGFGGTTAEDSRGQGCLGETLGTFRTLWNVSKNFPGSEVDVPLEA